MSDAEKKKSVSGSPTREEGTTEDDVVLLDLILVLVRNRWLIAKIVLAFAIVGIILAILPASRYQSDALLAPEGTETRGSQLSSLRQFGIDVGRSQDGFGPAAYPELLTGRSTRLGTVRDTVQIARLDTSYVLADYLTRPKGPIEKTVDIIGRYTVGLPGQVLDAFEEDISSRSVAKMSSEGSDDQTEGGSTLRNPTVYPTPTEERAMSRLESMYSVSRSSETGFITVQVTTEDPQLSAQIGDRLIHHFRERISAVRTKKAQENLDFIEEQFTEAEEELRRAENELARFLDRNSGIQTAALRTERERLERQVSFKEELYRQLQSQRNQARLEVQRSEPAVSVVERPVPALRPSGPNRVFYLLVIVVLGFGGAVGFVFARTFVENQAEQNAEARVKMRELKEALLPRRFWNGDRNRFKENTAEEATREQSYGD